MRRVNLRFTRLRDPFLPRLPGDARWALPILALACVLRGKRRARTPCPSSMLTALAPPVVRDSFSYSTTEQSIL